jgi:hypothetical protein
MGEAIGLKDLLASMFERGKGDTVMKYFTMSLALLLVVVIASTSMAAFTYSVVRQADPAAGLDSWMIKMGGVNAFTMTLTPCVTLPLSKVHQANRVIDPEDPTTLVNTLFVDKVPTTKLSAALDTHFMFASTAVATIGLTEYLEQNDMTDPSNSDTIKTDAYFYGLGDWGFPTSASVVTGSLLADGSNVLQVIIPKGMCLVLGGSVGGGGVTYPLNQLTGDPLYIHDGSITLGLEYCIPEPGTIVMLIAGALCLLGIRRK